MGTGGAHVVKNTRSISGSKEVFVSHCGNCEISALVAFHVASEKVVPDKTKQRVGPAGKAGSSAPEINGIFVSSRHDNPATSKKFVAVHRSPDKFSDYLRIIFPSFQSQ